jgi:hypothetical protein
LHQHYNILECINEDYDIHDFNNHSENDPTIYNCQEYFDFHIFQLVVLGINIVWQGRMIQIIYSPGKISYVQNILRDVNVGKNGQCIEHALVPPESVVQNQEQKEETCNEHAADVTPEDDGSIVVHLQLSDEWEAEEE